MNDVKLKLQKYKYPLLVMLLGLMLMLLPGNQKAEINDNEIDIRLQQLLSCTEGVGEAKVIVSENGVVVVCAGAENADVRLEIIEAVSSYTGFGAGKITVLKMAQ